MKAQSRIAAFIVTVMIFAFSTAKAMIGSRIVLNLTASAPRGLYRITPLTGLTPGKLVLFSLSTDTLTTFRDRSWFHPELPLLKPVGALPGDRVCMSDTSVTINGKRRGDIARVDSNSVPLPHARGCFFVDDGYFLPLSTYSDHSFDGRYFGEVSQSLIIGEATQIFTW